jgi:hypothetical protein
VTKVDDQTELGKCCFLHIVSIPLFDSVEWHPTMDAEDALLAMAGCAMAVAADKNGSTARSTTAQMGAIGKGLMCEEK